MGLAASLNTGFAHSKGDFLTWTSDDNYYDKNALKTLLSYLTNNKKYDFVYANCLRINENNRLTGSLKTDKPCMLDYYNCIGACFLYRRKVYNLVGDFNTNQKYLEDYEYWLRVRKLFPMKYIKNNLYYYRTHSKSMTENNREKTWLLYKQQFMMKLPFVHSKAKLNYLKADMALRENDKPASIVFIMKSLIANPFSFLTLRLAAIIILPGNITGILRKLKRVF
jgi:glycosyltransferase involved in cell wall biosynthesis